MLSANTRIVGGLFLLLLFCQGLCYAQITMPKVFGDNMVLQRDIKIPVWGSSDPGSNIIAELGGIRVTTNANKDGNELIGFAVAGHDRQSQWAKAKIEGNEVVAYSDKVVNSEAIRYAWVDNPNM
ncbi:hypothetical protein ACFSKL_07765 [Belliella marina]|uniref:Sialate O-acetylesterase n=1 Tax=Belliella marina TaxID=1644146 RepID=A0ABW4VKN4_9BACT